MTKKTTTKNRRWLTLARTTVVAIALAFIPLIYAGALTWANQDPTHNLNSVSAAVVNLDKPATVKDKTIDLGHELTDELTSSTEANNFDWQELDQRAATEALEKGEVLAVLTIPENFSANVASPAERDPADAAIATLHIETNDGANMISGTIATTIASTVRESLASQVSAEYLENVYLGFSDIHTSIADASEGATTLADGAKTAKEGGDSLVVGLIDLADGTTTLVSGADTLATGAESAHTGAQTLADGLVLLSSKVETLPDDATALNDGATQLSAGAATLATGVSDLSTAATQVSTGATAARDGATTVRDGLTALSATTPEVVTGATALRDGIEGVIAGWSLMTDEQRLAALTQLSAGADTLTTGLTEADAAVQQLAAGQSALVGSVDEGTGLATLAAGASQLSTGAATASTAANDLRDGAATLAAGTATLDLAVPALTDAIDSAQAGATTLATALNTLATGARDLADGTTTLDTGAHKASAGASDLASGLTQLSDGSVELSDGLSDGVDKIPTYTEAEAKALSEVAGEPIKTDSTRMNEVATYGYGLAPYFLALSLWVGGMSFYMMFAAMNLRALVRRRFAFTAALRSYAPGALMAVAQSALVTWVLLGPIGIDAANPWGLWALALLTSLTFVAMNQALVALLGAPGRFIALIMIVLQLSSAGGTYPVQTAPSFFQTIHPWLPMTHALEGFRSLIAGGTLGIENAVVTLTLWLIAALIATTIAHAISNRSRHVRTTAVQPDERDALGDESDCDEVGDESSFEAADEVGADALAGELSADGALERASGEPQADVDDLTHGSALPVDSATDGAALETSTIAVLTRDADGLAALECEAESTEPVAHVSTDVHADEAHNSAESRPGQ